MHPTKTAALLAIALATAASTAPLSAAQRSTFQNAVGACNGALPGFEGALRKRPLAIANEGTGNAIVSCTLPIDQTANTGNTAVGVGLINRTASLVAISCTFVDGTAPELVNAVPPTYYVENIALTAGEGGTIAWSAEDYSLDAFSSVASVSCNLPPGTEIAAFVNLHDDGN